MQIFITSNGVLLDRHIAAFKSLNIAGINISLDSLDPERYLKITGRHYLDKVLSGLEGAISSGIPVKINCVVLDDMLVSELLALAALAQRNPIEVRFIEHMTLNGEQQHATPNYNHKVIRDLLYQHFPGIVQLENRGKTAERYLVPDFTGSLGIIAGDSRSFCAQCNRLRVTANGWLKFCLYDKGAFSIADMLQQGLDDESISNRIRGQALQRFENGSLAQKACTNLSIADMVDIGG